MAKKRKFGGQSSGPTEPGAISNQDSKLRINTYEDVADSEDEFHINRDKIMFEEGPAQKRQRKLREEEEILEPSDEEVLAASEDVSESEQYSDEAQEGPVAAQQRSKPSKSGRRLQDSGSEASASPEVDEDVGGWGTSRKDYYNADIIETEADALEEEAEAKRLQQKQLQGMTEADFGFDEADWLDAGEDGVEAEGRGQGKVIREVLPKLRITDAMGPEERLKMLRTRYPEFEPLAKEFVDLQSVYDELKTAAIQATVVQKRIKTKAQSTTEAEESKPTFAVVKHSILAAYLAALSMYFAIFTSNRKDTEGDVAAIPPEELRDHAIMGTLVQCRDLWQKVRNVKLPETGAVDMKSNHVSENKVDKARINGVQNISQDSKDKHKKRKNHKSKAQQASEAAEAKAQALRAKKIRKTEEELADLSALIAPSKQISKPKATPMANEDTNSDFGEQTSLTPQEAAEKAKRKKSLSFYTSQIAQKSNKRDAAGRGAGGDADIPYRERLKDKQARLNAEAEKRGKKPSKALTKEDELGGPSDEEDHAARKELRNGDGEDDHYYALIASRSASAKAAKAAKAARAQAIKAGNLAGPLDDDTVGDDGKRGITYQIEKNKGIMPKRKKEVRNSRVKKRIKFDQKKKKLGSVRQVYGGGEGRGGYKGEMTGIKKGLVRSVKL